MSTVRERIEYISQQASLNELALPTSAKVEICGMCTFKCKFCYQKELRKNGMRQHMMSSEDFNRVVAFLKTIPTLKEVGLFILGESAMNKNLAKFYSVLKQEGYFTYLTTNGSMLDTVVEAIPYIDSLKVSWNYTDENDFIDKTQTNRTMFDNVKANILKFYEACHENGKTLAISTILDGDKNRYIQELGSLKYDEHYWIPLQNQCGTNKNGYGGIVGESEHIRNQMPCWPLFKMLYIDVDMNVRTCCYGHYKCHILYNVKDVPEFTLPSRLVQMRTLQLDKIVPRECQNCINGN